MARNTPPSSATNGIELAVFGSWCPAAAPESADVAPLEAAGADPAVWPVLAMAGG
jgi:hypothetical protein